MLTDMPDAGYSDAVRYGAATEPELPIGICSVFVFGARTSTIQLSGRTKTMLTDEMVEAAARAMAEAEGFSYQSPDRYYARRATAALTAALRAREEEDV